MISNGLLQRLARDPLIHFLLIGAGIYGAYALLDTESSTADPNSITITQEEIRALTDQWTRLWNRPPTEAELAGVLRGHVRTRVLYQEALAMGLDKQDPVIERRLAQKVELLSRSLVTPDTPSDEVLAAWYANNTDRFREPATFTLFQVFFDPDRRGEATVGAAEAALAELLSLDAVPDDLSGYGDDTFTQNYYPARTELQLGKTFGSGFAEQVVRLEPGQWHGPIFSGFGAHLVYLQSVRQPAAPALADVHDAVQEAWMMEQVDTLSEQFIEELVTRYDIVVQETEVAMTVPPIAEAGE